MVPISDRDLQLARRLPDDIIQAGGGSVAHRLVELVGQHWGQHEMRARAELVEALLPIVEPLLEAGARVTNRERGVCEAIVLKWLERQ
jgi:hypothetical protein